MEKEIRTLEQLLAWPSRMSWERWQYFREIVKVRVADDNNFNTILQSRMPAMTLKPAK
jgi:hypothetical protein